MKSEKEKLLEQIKGYLLEREEIVFAYVLGTFLDRDDFRDIDLALFLDEKKMEQVDTLDWELELSLELEERVKPGRLFERYVPVDVKALNGAPVCFRYSVSKGLVLFSRDENAREEFVCRTWKEYIDFRYILDNYYKEVLYD